MPGSSSEHDYERDDEDIEPTHFFSFSKTLSNTKALLDRTHGLVWNDVTAPVNDAHQVVAQWNKAPPVKQLGIKMHPSTCGRSEAEGALQGTYGKLTFNQDLERQKQSKDAKFACMCSDTDPDLIQQLLLKHWKLEKPSVIISITGSAQDIVLESGLEAMIRQGIARAAQATKAWTFTGGMDVGVMALVADALARHKTGTPVIGVAPYHRVTDNQRFFSAERDARRVECGQCRRRVHYVKRTPNSYASAALDSQHTHFLLVDAGTEKKNADWGSEIPLRVAVEDKLCASLFVPRVLLVIQGGRGTFKTVLESLQSNSPVVLIKESRGCAQAIAEFIAPLLENKAQYLNNQEVLKKKVAERMEDEEFDARFKEILDHKWFVDKVKPMLKEIGEALQLLHVFTMTDVHRVPFDMAVLNAIVSSFKLREDQEAEAEARMLRKKELRALVPKEMRPHQSARLMKHVSYMGKRVPVSDEQVSWSFEMRYNPTEFTDGTVAKFAADPVTGFGPNTWADPHDLRGPAVTAGFESLEAEVRARRTFVQGSAMRLDQVAVFEEETGRPINPSGRTGMRGRGLLGRWGPNYAADPIVTRFQGNQLQMVAIRRKDTGQWAIPGGMVDAGEAVTTTLLREFKEEAGDFGEASQKQRFDEMVDRLFENGELVYVGYVDDPRNTDNAWMETTAYHFHCNDTLAHALPLKAGDDAKDVTWLDVDVSAESRYRDLYASHRDWVDRVAEKMKPHTQSRKELNAEYKAKRTKVPDGMVTWAKDFPSYVPPDFTADSVLQVWHEKKEAGWADPPEAAEVPDLHGRLSYEGPIVFEESTGRPLNPRGRTGMRGRGLLGNWGPNHAADPIVTRFHPQTNRLQVVANRREDTGQFAIRGGMSGAPGEKWNAKVRETFLGEIDDSEEKTSFKQYFSVLLDDLFAGEEAKVVYRGYVDDPRNTDNAWLETTAYHFHCSRELGALLPLNKAPPALTPDLKQKLEQVRSSAGGMAAHPQLAERLGLNQIFWIDVEDVLRDNDFYASHRDWIVAVHHRIKNLEEHPGLLQLVVQWGRVDIAQSVFHDPTLLAQRQPTQVQRAFQQGLKHALEPNFDLQLIELLMDKGAKAADVYIPELFELEGKDAFGLFKDMNAIRRRFTWTSWRANSKNMSKERILRREVQKAAAVTPEAAQSEASPGNNRLRMASQKVIMENTATKGLRRPFKRQDQPLAAVAKKEDAARTERSNSEVQAAPAADDDPKLSMTPWRDSHVRFMRKYVKGFDDYARDQHAIHNVDLMFWAITAGSIPLRGSNPARRFAPRPATHAFGRHVGTEFELAQQFWKRCRSPLRAALIAQDMLKKIKVKGQKKVEIELQESWFSRQAIGVLENLPDQETARRLLLSKEGDFATLGARGKQKENILELAIALYNKDFVAQRCCQEILDEMWWGRTPRSGRVCCKSPFPEGYLCYLQLFFPFLRVLPVVPNDLCVGYPWCTPDELQRNGKVVTVSRWRAMAAIWHIPRMKRAVFSISNMLFDVLFVLVFLDRLCGPLDGTRGVLFWLLVTWTFAHLVQEVLQAWIDFREWRKNVYNKFDVFGYILLLIAFVLRFQLSTAGQEPGHYVAEDLASWFNQQSGGRIRPVLHSTGRASEENFRNVWVNVEGSSSKDLHGNDIGECPWSWELEFLRPVLALTAIVLMASLLDLLSMSKRIGVLMVCTGKMLKQDLLAWAAFVLVAVMLGSAFTMNFLAPNYQLEAGTGAFKPFGGLSWGPTEWDVSAGGPFFATFWGLFGFYEPGELASATGSSFFAPVVMWVYMMILAVVFINLLIAMFNQTYNDTYVQAQEEYLMNRVHAVRTYTMLFPVPPPLNLIAIVWDMLRLLWSKLCRCGDKNRVEPEPVDNTMRSTSSLRESPSGRQSARQSEDSPSRAPLRKRPCKSASFATAEVKEEDPAPMAAANNSTRSALSKKGTDQQQPTERLHSELQRQATRMRLMRHDSTLNRGSYALFNQEEAELAEDGARHFWLQQIERSPHLVMAVGNKEEQIHAALRKIDKEGGEMRAKLEMLVDKVEKLELEAMEDRQTARNQRSDLAKQVSKAMRDSTPGDERRSSPTTIPRSSSPSSSSQHQPSFDPTLMSKLDEVANAVALLTENLNKAPRAAPAPPAVEMPSYPSYMKKAATQKSAPPQQLPPLPSLPPVPLYRPPPQ